jgi:plastocyanin
MIRRFGRFGAVAALAVAVLPAVTTINRSGATAATGPPLKVLVDHVDQANQQPFPPFNRLFEYTDFFSRAITVHQGDTVNFQTQPFTFHIVTLARDEAAARRVYKVLEPGDGPPAVGTGLPKIGFGNGNFPVVGGSTHGGGVTNINAGKGPPSCGAVQFQQAPCTFRGSDDVEILGPTVGWDRDQVPTAIDQHVLITAPPGRYTYFDMLHPGMRGTLTVVAPDRPASTQAEVDAQGQRQFEEDRGSAIAVEAAFNRLPMSMGPAGSRVFVQYVGAGAANDHVSIHEMLPNHPLETVPGDRVQFLWPDAKGYHNIGFAAAEEDLPEPFGFDCTPAHPDYQGVPNTFNTPPPPGCLQPGKTVPTHIGDPGNAPSGTVLRAAADQVDSGILVGAGFRLSPSAQAWAVSTDSHTAAGAHPFWCTVHAWMTNTVNMH